MLLQRLAVATCSTALALGAAWLYWEYGREEEGIVEFIDDGEGLNEILAARVAAGDGTPPPADPARLGWDFARRLSLELSPNDRRILFPQLKKKRVTPVPGVHYSLLANRKWPRTFREHPQGEFVRRTNGLGIREDYNPSDAPVDLSIVLMGDSHMEGVCANSESTANQLEASLRVRLPDQRVEVWNTGVSGYGYANYLGTLDAYGQLEPEYVVLVTYGGNDFRDGLGAWRFIYRQPGGPSVSDEYLQPLRKLGVSGSAMLGQEIHQALTFMTYPEAMEDALRISVATGIELDRQARERGTKFLLVYLPPPSCGQPRRFAPKLKNAMKTINADPKSLKLCESLADGLLGQLKKASVRTLDLRPAFAASSEQLYWTVDLHLNVRGHALAARLIEDELFGIAGVPR